MTTSDPLFVTKTQILKLLGLTQTQFDSLKTKGVLPKAIGPAKTAKYDLKAVLDGWIAFKTAENSRKSPDSGEDVKTQHERLKMEMTLLKIERENRNLITLDFAVALLNRYITTLKDALTTLEYGWSPELVGLKTEADVMKKLAELRDRMMLTLQDPEDFDVNDFFDELEADQDDEDPDEGQ